MARPQIASDDAILQAARRVMTRRGVEAFTLSEVAEEAGVSRATIIMRFESAQALKVRLTAERVETFSAMMQALPPGRGGDALLELAALIGDMVGQRNRSAVTSFMRTYHANQQDEELLALERRRTDEFRNAVAQRMPKLAIPDKTAIALFMSHIGGSLLEWEGAATRRDPKAHLIQRTRQWLRLARIPYTAKQARAAAAKPKIAGKRTAIASS